MRTVLTLIRELLVYVAAGLVPKRVAYYLLIKIGIEHMGGPEHPDELMSDVPYMTILERLEKEEGF